MALEIKEAYNQMLDECYPEVKIGYSTFTASDILANCDPIMYEQGLLDYQDSMMEGASDDFPLYLEYDEG